MHKTQKDVMYTAYKNSMEDYHGMLWVQKILDVRKISVKYSMILVCYIDLFDWWCSEIYQKERR